MKQVVLAVILVLAALGTQAQCHRVVMIGDSITANWQPSGTLNGYPVIFSGVSGQWSVNMYDRFQQDVIESGADCVQIIAGTNDLTPGSEGWGGVSTHATHMMILAMTELALWHHIKVFIGTIPPWGNGTVTNDPKWARDPETHLTYDAWLRSLTSFFAENGWDAQIIDYEALLVDPANGLHYLPQYTVDGLHPSQAGYEAMTGLFKKSVGW
jgi:lysophospholipase L1-like esterase